MVIFHIIKNWFQDRTSHLRCFQWLFHPNVAIQLCNWYYNWYTRGWSFPVLSYKRMALSIFCIVIRKKLLYYVHPKKIGSVLFLNALNPTHVPFSSANSRTLGSFFTSRMWWVDIALMLTKFVYLSLRLRLSVWTDGHATLDVQKKLKWKFEYFFLDNFC